MKKPRSSEEKNQKSLQLCIFCLSNQLLFKTVKILECMLNFVKISGLTPSELHVPKSHCKNA